jgi:hypothetical protein
VGLGADPAGAGAAPGDEGGQRLPDGGGAAQAGGQHHGVLERQRGTLGHVGGHAVGGVADQHHRPAAPLLGGDLLDGRDVHATRVLQLRQQVRHRRGEAGEALAQPRHRVAAATVGVGGVGVAVDRSPAHRHGQERRAPAEQHRPGGDLRRAGGQEAPAVLADRDRRARVAGQPPGTGMQAVGADHQVELAGAAVVEGDPDRPLDPLQGDHGAARPQRHALQQDLVQVGPRQRQARPDVAPQLPQVDVGQQPPAVVQQPLARDRGGAAGHRVLQAQRPQDADAVGGQVHAGAGAVEALGPLDHLGREPGLPQRPGQCQAGQPGPDHQDPAAFHHNPPRSLATVTPTA